VPDDALAEATLARARAGDEQAFRELTESHRRERQLHCYRILGSVQDAGDLVQETLLAAWRGLETFQGGSSLRAWLYRIATNLCLNGLRARSHRPQQRQTVADSRGAHPPDRAHLARAEVDPAAGRSRPLRLNRTVVLPIVALLCVLLVLAFVPPALSTGGCRLGPAGKSDLVSLP
jgi:DNA-directed RNA polymerase specialized sigma24 family protein